jgi:Rrf2 family protein
VASPTSTRFALAVHVLALLGGGGDAPLRSDELAASAGASAEHVRRILAPLRAAGLVVSRPGPCGGWRLARDPCAITLADVRHAVQGGADPVFGLPEPGGGCTVGARIREALVDVEARCARAVEQELATMTVAALAARTDAGLLRHAS